MKDKLIQLNSKYDALRSFSLYDVLSLSYIGIVVDYIRSGRPLTPSLQRVIFPVTKIRPSWEQLHDWVSMSNPEFIKTYNLVLKDIRDKKIPDIRTAGSVIVWLSFSASPISLHIPQPDSSMILAVSPCADAITGIPHAI